jgi:hypothetical protein
MSLSLLRSVRIDVREGKKRRGTLIWVMSLVLGMAVYLPAGAQAAPSDSAGANGRAADCTTEAKLSRERPSVVRYVVWCGVQSGRVTLRIRRPKGPPLLGFSRSAQAAGPGASGPLRCRSQSGGRVFCSGRKDGPVTFRGSLTVAAGTRCATLLSLNVWRWTGDTLDFPTGCPKSYEEPERRLRQIIGERAWYGLDRDLEGDRAAIVRRAKGLLRAWRRGDPVARWTSEEEAFGMPLRAFEQVELEYRDTYRERFQDLVEDGDWIAKNAPDTYAGYEIVEAHGGIIYVGFTVEPEATLEKLKRLLIAPERFKPFPVTPTYTEAELEEIWFDFPSRKSPLWNLVNMSSIDYLANKVEVGTEHVARVRRLITREYGPDAPFRVVFALPAVALSSGGVEG